MILLGIVYLAYQKSILAQAVPEGADGESLEVDNLSRAILGVQIGLVALAMFVTRSSVASLQAKTGLPLGTQVMGWTVFGMFVPISAFLHSYLIAPGSILAHPSICPWVGTKQPLSPPACGHLSCLCSHVHHPHHLIRRPVLLCL